MNLTEKGLILGLVKDGRVGCRKLWQLQKTFGSLENLFENPFLAQLDSDLQEIIQELQTKISAEKETETVQKLGGELVGFDEPKYPTLLKEIADPPLLLLVKGSLEGLKKPSLSVVGTRRNSTLGEEAVERIVLPLAEMGVTIVSGLALGIDSLAHRAALKGKSTTIAVLGTDFVKIYPASNQNLLEEIIDSGGGVITEYPPGAPIKAYNFPLRNRIIAGLTKATLIVEAPQKSGALITARLALESNRDVMAVPGEITRSGAWGTNNLIKLGAKLVTEPQDVLTEMGWEGKIKSCPKPAPQGKTEESILEILAEGEATIDELVEKTSLPIEEINGSLIMLEIKGLIKSLGGGKYMRVD